MTEHVDPETGEVTEAPLGAFRDASPSIDKIAPALAKAQGAVEAVRKGRTAEVVPKDKGRSGYQYTYADLASVREACRRALADNGLSILVRPLEGRKLEVMLLHESTQWISSEWPLYLGGGGPQDFGSALTYTRRQAEQCLLGIAPADDDDGAAAQQRRHRGRQAHGRDQQPSQRGRQQSPEAQKATELGQLTARYVAELSEAGSLDDLKRIAAQIDKIEFPDGHAARLKQAYDERLAELGDEAAA